jgi:hypothetical protein
MFPVQRSIPAAAPTTTWRIAQDEAAFEAIFEDGVNLVVWRRNGRAPAIDPTFVDPPRRLMRSVGGQSVSSQDVARALDLEAPTPFATDVARLVELFATLTDAQGVGIRLEATARQTCPKWHTDRVGTEWLDGDAAHRASTGDVLIAKGELWPSAPGACVHRSPDPQGATRLLLTLDELR